MHPRFKRFSIAAEKGAAPKMKFSMKEEKFESMGKLGIRGEVKYQVASRLNRERLRNVKNQLTGSRREIKVSQMRESRISHRKLFGAAIVHSVKTAGRKPIWNR